MERIKTKTTVYLSNKEYRALEKVREFLDITLGQLEDYDWDTEYHNFYTECCKKYPIIEKQDIFDDRDFFYFLKTPIEILLQFNVTLYKKEHYNPFTTVKEALTIVGQLFHDLVEDYTENNEFEDDFNEFFTSLDSDCNVETDDDIIEFLTGMSNVYCKLSEYLEGKEER